MTINSSGDTISNSVNHYTDGKIKPEISIVDQGLEEIGNSTDKDNVTLDVSKIQQILKLEKLMTPNEQIDLLIKKKLGI